MLLFCQKDSTFKSDPVLEYMRKAFLGLTKVSRPLVIPKEGARSEKNKKIELVALAGPKCEERTFGRFWGAISIFFAEPHKTNCCRSVNLF